MRSRQTTLILSFAEQGHTLFAGSASGDVYASHEYGRPRTKAFPFNLPSSAPSSLAIVMALFGPNPRELGKALGIWGGAAAAGGTAGVFLGGAITEWLSWHWVINIPLGLGVLVSSPQVLRRGVARRGEVDWLGAFSITAAQVILVFTLVTVEHAGWPRGLYSWVSP